MEPPTKRPRLAHLIAEEMTDEDGDELNFQPHEVSEMRDPDFQLAKKREAVGNRFQAAMSSIFDKYSRDFGNIGDEIDFETGEVVVDNGHLANMRYDGDIGLLSGLNTAQSDGDEEEEEGILLEDWGVNSDGVSVGEGEGERERDDKSAVLPSKLSATSKNIPSPSTDLQIGGVAGSYPWDFEQPPSFPGPSSHTIPFWPFPYGQQPSHFPGQPGLAFPSLDQHPALLPFANLHPHFMPGPLGSLPPSISGPGGDAPFLSQGQPEKRVQRSHFTSRFFPKGKKNVDDEGQGDETRDYDAQSGQPTQELNSFTDEEDELLSGHHSIPPRELEEISGSSATTLPDGLDSARAETEDIQNRVVVELPKLSTHRRNQYKHISTNTNGILLTPPTSVADVSDSDGDRSVNKARAQSSARKPDSTVQSAVEEEPNAESQQLSNLPIPMTTVDHRMDDSDSGYSISQKNDDAQDSNATVRSKRSNSKEINTQIKSEYSSADMIFTGSATRLHAYSRPSPPPNISAQDIPTDIRIPPLLKTESPSPARQFIAPQDKEPSDSPEVAYISPTKPQKRSQSKHSPANPPSEPGSATSQKVSKLPLTPRHSRVPTVKTPSTRRSILSLLSDEEEDEFLFSEKHAVAIPNLFSSSRRKKYKSRGHNSRSKIDDTPTKKRPRRGSPPNSTNSTTAICGVDNYRCGRDFCFNCLPE